MDRTGMKGMTKADLRMQIGLPVGSGQPPGGGRDPGRD